MEKRELREAHSPILKPVPEETSTPSSPSAATTQTSPVQPQPPTEEPRRVTFDIGDSDDVDNKDGTDTDSCNTNGGECESLEWLDCLCLW